MTNLESEELPEFHVLQAGVDVVTHPLDMLNRLRPPASVDEIPRKVCGSSLAELMLLVTCLTLGCALVFAATESSRPLLRSVLADTVVRAD